MIRLTATTSGLFLEKDARVVRTSPEFTLDRLFSAPNPGALAAEAFAAGTPTAAPAPDTLRAPIESQEVWAAGVTYLRSKSARMAESKDSGGGTFYDRVYDADRPELFSRRPRTASSLPARPCASAPTRNGTSPSRNSPLR